ncbi:hypothetical protein MSG28_006865 [Choristoneura fumiferana]|uniref:Uncharacterized protein n=1 Tax=Choristoneura fumiferana TaxID=7141 RepID=A0ACC0JLE6_CHOFU|nr:hypothetical protein MSG28_006865 [Choristoneura fumiferana]
MPATRLPLPTGHSTASILSNCIKVIKYDKTGLNVFSAISAKPAGRRLLGFRDKGFMLHFSILLYLLDDSAVLYEQKDN